MFLGGSEYYFFFTIPNYERFYVNKHFRAMFTYIPTINVYHQPWIHYLDFGAQDKTLLCTSLFRLVLTNSIVFRERE